MMKYILQGKITSPDNRNKIQTFRFNSQSTMIYSPRDNKLTGVVLDSSLKGRKNNFQGYPTIQNNQISNIKFYNAVYNQLGKFEGVKFGYLTQTSQDENTQQFEGTILEILEITKLEHELLKAKTMNLNALERKLKQLLGTSPFQLESTNKIKLTLKKIEDKKMQDK